MNNILDIQVIYNIVLIKLITKIICNAVKGPVHFEIHKTEVTEGI